MQEKNIASFGWLSLKYRKNYNWILIESYVKIYENSVTNLLVDFAFEKYYGV